MEESKAEHSGAPASADIPRRSASGAASSAIPATGSNGARGGNLFGLQGVEVPCLAGLLALALIARLWVAIALPSIHHPDEVFQYWEQAYRLVFGHGVVPWEYRVGIRSWLVPGALSGIIWLVDAVAGNGPLWRFAVQFVLSLISLSVVATAYLWARRLSGIGAAMLAGTIAGLWFELVYFSPKPLTEVLSAAALFPAAYLLCATPRPGLQKRLFGGMLLGLSFVLRFHLAPTIALILLWSAIGKPWRWSLPQVAAAAGAVLAAGLLDWATWGAPFQSIWLNLAINLFDGKASTYGVEPFHGYLLFYMQNWGEFALPMAGLILLGARRVPVMLAIAVVLLLSHSAIAHKEYRFIYPALPFLLTLAALGTSEIFRLAKGLLPRFAGGALLPALAAAWLAISLFLALQGGFRPYFTKERGAIDAFATAGRYPQACGLALVGRHWAGTPGYSGLQRDIPIYLLSAQAVAEMQDAERAAYNVMVYYESDSAVAGNGYSPLGCSHGMCVAARPGTCAPSSLETVNETLERTGQ